MFAEYMKDIGDGERHIKDTLRQVRKIIDACGITSIGDLERAFAGSDQEARRLVVDLAGRMEDQRGRKLLLAALADDSARVRAEAALALGEGGFMDALRPLMDLKASDPSPEVRQAAAAALKKLAPR